jgi:hypothetical protein
VTLCASRVTLSDAPPSRMGRRPEGRPAPPLMASRHGWGLDEPFVHAAPAQPAGLSRRVPPRYAGAAVRTRGSARFGSRSNVRPGG